MIAKININLASVTDKQSLFDVFASTFSFPAYFGKNWDALSDMMSSLDPAAEVFQNLKNPLTGVHLMFDGFDTLDGALSPTDILVFKSLLVDLSASREYRGDHLSFTFEVRYLG
jgi:RNAse (barnase) inhibitor barstar